MIARLLSCALAVMAVNAVALPIQLPFTSELRTNDAVATTSALSQVRTGSSPPTALPLTTDAFVVDPATGDFASAGAINAVGLLATNAEADSTAGLASAVADARFVGTFLGRGALELQLGFFPSSFALGSGFADANLFVTVLSGASTVFSDVFIRGGLIDLFLNVPSGTLGTLDILLSSAANVITGGSAQNFASVTISATTTVPEPSTWLLMALVSILAVAVSRMRVQPKLA